MPFFPILHQIIQDGRDRGVEAISPHIMTIAVNNDPNGASLGMMAGA
jgi:hypothetical protein